MNANTSAPAATCATQEAQKLVAQLRTGDALPDALHATLQGIRSTGDGERLRVFTRTVQRALEIPR